MELKALYAGLTALAVATLFTPLTARLAFGLGAVDQPSARGLSERATPRLGGIAIFLGVFVAGALWLPGNTANRGILAGAALITLLMAIDDAVDLAPQFKLAAQFVAALIPVASGVRVNNITLPIVGALNFGEIGGPLTLVGIVVIMNIVNLSDGVDGLAAGVCTISAITFAVIAFDLGRRQAGVLAALTAGAALGFLLFNFEPASVFMGDSGSNLLGLLLGCTVVQGEVKTNAVLALFFPLVVLAVPFLDSTFVVAKRIKHGRPVYRADRWHFHHRFSNIGFSKRRTVIYLYAWTISLAALALALRFVPYSDHHGHYRLGWSLVLACFGLIALAASFYLVVVLEILKFKGVRSRAIRQLRPETSEHEIDEQVAHELETGELQTVPRPPSGDGAPALPGGCPE